MQISHSDTRRALEIKTTKADAATESDKRKISAKEDRPAPNPQLKVGVRIGAQLDAKA